MIDDPVKLEILWNRLIATVNEEAATIVRTSFSAIVRESGDLAAAVFDRRGRMIAQAVTGTPGHTNSMSFAAKHLLKAFPVETLVPGDVLITNDPWLVSGQLNDDCMLTPVFHGGEVVAFFGSLVHLPDIGGRGTGAEAASVYEEGLLIPPMKLMDAGRPNDVLYSLIRANVRQVDRVLGDIEAQIIANEVGSRKLIEIIEHYEVDFDSLADSILEASSRAMRTAIRTANDGEYHGEVRLDGAEFPIVVHTKVTIDDGTVTVDFDGTSPQSSAGINVCINYTHAYTTFAVRSVLAPEIPNNDGSLEPIRVVARPGSIVNAVHPAPVSARHIVGMNVPFAVINALAQVVPERVMAEGSGALWGAEVMGAGTTQFGILFFASGGMGARVDKDGLSTTCYPTGVSGLPVEGIESATPLVVWRKELMPESRGGGRHVGGMGQRVELGVRIDEPWSANLMVDRLISEPQGLFGGENGCPGRLRTSKRPAIDPKRRIVLDPDERLIMETPGGGGYGPAATSADPPSAAAPERELTRAAT